MRDKVAGDVLRLRRRMRQTRDPNFIGFDKYRGRGAYHWRVLEQADPGYLAKADLISSHADAGSWCMDLGCGDGAFVHHLSGRVQHVVGIDADYDAIRCAREELRKVGASNTTVLQMPLSQVTRRSVDRAEGFGLVYSMDVFEHLPDPSELVRRSAEMVAEGGVVLIGTPLFIRDDLVSKYHVKEYSRTELREIIGSGLRIEREVVLPERREDDEVYDESFYVAVCSTPGSAA